jgi:hypothetical protein
MASEERVSASRQGRNGRNEQVIERMLIDLAQRDPSFLG